MIDNIEWPEGAEAFVKDYFRKWVGVIEYLYHDNNWHECPIKWSIEKYIAEGYEIQYPPSENKPEQNDVVNNPSHYQIMPGVEFKDIRRALLEKCDDEGVPAWQVDCWSRSFEYIGRMWGKNGLEDAKKARVYLDWLIEAMEQEK